MYRTSLPGVGVDHDPAEVRARERSRAGVVVVDHHIPAVTPDLDHVDPVGPGHPQHVAVHLRGHGGCGGLGQARTVEASRTENAIRRRMSGMERPFGHPAYRPFGQT